MIGLNRPLTTSNGLKLLGERNSGTNVLEALLAQISDLHLFPSLPMLTWRDIARYSRPLSALWRYRAAQEETLDNWHRRDLPRTGGWKHAAPSEAFETEFLSRHQPAVLIITRHPVSWLRSMHRNPFHALHPVPADFSDFLRQTWICTARDGVANAAPPALLAAKLHAYARLLDHYPNSALIRYEDLLANPEKTLSAIGLNCPPNLRLLERDPRSFAKTSSATSYATKAAMTRFTSLAEDDVSFVQNALAGSPALALYSE